MPTSRLCGARRMTSLSPNRMLPSSGRMKPASTIRSVVLPEPDGPEQRQELAASNVEVDVVERRDLAVGLGDPANGDGDGGGAAHADASRPRAHHSVSMLLYSSAARASFLMYQSRLIGICLAAFSGDDGSFFAYAASMVPSSYAFLLVGP